MKIAICYPPFSRAGRFPNLPQNRQFIYTASKAVKLYPVVMATAATWLKNLGHSILWLDGITRRMPWKAFEKALSSFDPEMIVLETKAPIMKNLWKLINRWKMKKSYWTITLVGDHATYFPEESLKNSRVDFVLTGGDYDFLLVNLVNHLEQRKKLEPGIWSRSKSQKLRRFKLSHNLDQRPVIDRKLTRWQDYGEAYLFHPCAYVMFGRGCAMKNKRPGVCNFCIWQQALWRCSARLMSPEYAVDEIRNLVNLGVKEIFDDTESGALWDYQWLKEFYRLLKKEDILNKIIFSSNARGDLLDKKTCWLLKKLGYRLLKIGLESGSNKILAKINKKERVEDIIQGVKNAKDVGLRVMLTIMVGYPWEGEEDVKKTYQVARQLMFYKIRAGDCLQASMIVPYPGTPLWFEVKKKGWLAVKADDYEKFDMSRPVLKTKIDAQEWCHKIWSIQRQPKFVLKSGLTVSSRDDFVLLFRGAKSFLGHLLDFSKKQ